MELGVTIRWSVDVVLRGGFGYELGKHLLNQGYKVCAVKYNTTEQRAEHYVVSN